MNSGDLIEEMKKTEEFSTIEIIDSVGDELRDELREIQSVLPNMNSHVVDQSIEPQENSIISDEEITGIYADILGLIKEDRQQVSGFIDTMAEMVINDGDATTSSKEALVNLIKIKVDMTDKMSKVADMMTRVKLKEKDTFPKYLATNQNNTININESGSRRNLIEAINKAKNNKEKNV
jgi:hypothetical protein